MMIDNLNLVISIINSGSLDDFKIFVDENNLIEIFDNCDDTGTPIFEILIKRIIRDEDFKCFDMETMASICYHCEYSICLLEAELSDKYFHSVYSDSHRLYMLNILKAIINSKLNKYNYRGEFLL